MIDQKHGNYVVICDFCNNEYMIGLDDFEAVSRFMKHNLQFESAKVDGQWNDKCVACQLVEG